MTAPAPLAPSLGLRSALAAVDEAPAATAGERGRDRHRRLAVATVAGVGSRVVTALSVLVALPVATAHLSPDEAGVWTLLVTAVALFGFADLGIGNGLLTSLSAAVGRGDRREAQAIVSSAWLGLSLAGAAMGVTAAVLLVTLPWRALLNVAPGDVDGLPLSLVAFFACVVVAVPAGIGQRIHLAHQQGWAATTVTGAGSLLALLGVLVAAATGAGLAAFVAAMVGGPAVAASAETWWVLRRSHAHLAPRRASVDLAVLRALLRRGGLFFVLAAAGAVAYQTDSLVVAEHLGAREVTQLGASARLFLLAPSLLTGLLLPLWPAYGEATARRDLAWVRATVRRSLAVSAAVSAAASAVLLLVAPALLRAWLPEVDAAPFGLLLALAAWAVVFSFSTALGVYLNGTDRLSLQVGLAATMAVANVALSLWLVRRIGVAGPVWASVVTQLVIVVLPLLVLLRRELSGDRT